MSTRATSKGRVAITGRGVISALGSGVQESWGRLVAGESGVRAISRFDPSGLKTRIAATIDAYDAKGGISNVERAYRCARDVVHQALDEAGLRRTQRTGMPVYFGSPVSEGDLRARIALHRAAARPRMSASIGRLCSAPPWLASTLATENSCASNGARLADEFGLDGAVTTLTTACASGASAIQLATDAIRRGEVERALVVAADAEVSHEAIARFSLLSALSTANSEPPCASRPFDAKRDGFVMGEGAGCFVLESDESARARRARIWGYVLGCGSATDNFHKTRSNPSGQYIVACMHAALVDAGLSPTQIDSINAHGTSTQENDKMESLGINLLFADHAKNILVTSNKSMVGHTLCAAGAVEAVFSLQSLVTGVIPPTINWREPDPAVALNLVANQAREARVSTVMSNSLGFGGQNSSLIFGAAP